MGSFFGITFFNPPTSFNTESNKAYRALTATLAGNGVYLEIFRLEYDFMPTEIGGVDVSNFLGQDATPEQIEGIANQIGDDAALGRAIRLEVLKAKSPKALGKMIIKHFHHDTKNG